MIMRNLSKALAVSACLAAMFATKAAEISLDFVPVGNPGNTADPLTGHGAVGYTYDIGRYEVTLNQYSAFLNAVAGTDAYGLYSPFMEADGRIAGIARQGAAGSYTYSVIGDGNRPVTYVSWFDAARFANWLNNGQPIGLQSAASTEDGAYTLNGAIRGVNFAKNPDASFWIPTQDEWYKAAFFQPASQGGDADDYWLYPTRDNSAPDHGHANFATPGDDLAAIVDRLKAVGSYTDAASYFGTFDQAGNVEEWNDSIPDSLSALRRIGGGSWFSDWDQIMSAYLPHPNDGGEDPAFEWFNTGFRLASLSVPEPGVGGIMGVGLLLLARRKRKR